MAGYVLQPAWSKKINPKLRDQEIMPASLSNKLITGLLREKLGFNTESGSHGKTESDR